MLRSLKLLGVWLAIALLSLPVMASQGNLVLPTTGPAVSGLAMTTDTNAALAALGSCNSGASAPTNNVGGVAVAGQCWWDTSGALPVLKVYDGANWVRLNVVDSTNHAVLPPQGVRGTTTGTNTIVLTTSYDPGSALYDGETVCFAIGTTNTAATTFSVNSSTAHPLRTSPSVDFTSGMLVQGSVYCATYRLSSTEWITQGFYTTSASQQVPSGAEFIFSGFTAPSGYFIENGQAVSRSTYAALLAVETITLTGNRTSGSPIITGLASTTDLSPGWVVEGTGIPVNATVLSIDSATQITLSANASSGSATATSLQFFPHGHGDGSTTFNVPNWNGYTPVGQDNAGGVTAGVGQVTTTLTCTSGSTACAVTSSAGLAIGMFIRSTNVPAGTTIAAIVGTAVTLSGNASATSAVSARFSPVYDAQGVGKTGGALSQAITQAEAPNYNLDLSGVTASLTTTISSGSNSKNNGSGGSFNYASPPNSTPLTPIIGGTLSTGGGGAPMPEMPPTKVTKFIIKQ